MHLEDDINRTWTGRYNRTWIGALIEHSLRGRYEQNMNRGRYNRTYT